MRSPLRGRVDEEAVLFPVSAIAKKQNRYAHEASKTRRINGRDVHAAKGEFLDLDMRVLQDHLKKFPDADRDFFEIACKNDPHLQGVLKLVRAGAI